MRFADNLNPDVPILLRPGVNIHLSDETETVLIDDSRTLPLVGSAYFHAMKKLVHQTTVSAFVDSFDGIKGKATARLILHKLVGEGMVIAGNPARARWLCSDNSIIGTSNASIPCVQLISSGSACVLSRHLTAALGGLGVEVRTDVDGIESPRRCIYLAESYRDIDSSLLSIEVPTIVVVTSDLQTIVGPILGADRIGWQIIFPRLPYIRNTDVHHEARGSETLSVLGLHWASTEILRWLSASQLSLGDRSLRSINHSSMSVRDHPILGLEGESTLEFDLDQPLSVVGGSTVEESVVRSSRDEDTLLLLAPLVDIVCGVASLLQKIELAWLPVYITMHNNGSHQSGRLRSTECVVAASGKGYSADAAKSSCIGEAIERFSCGQPYNADFLVARADSLDLDFLHPSTILGFSETQYLERTSDFDGPQGRRFIGFNWVPPPFEESEPVGWVYGIEVFSKRKTLLPAALTYFNYTCDKNPNELQYGHADSNGCAAGLTYGEALLHALLELIERDACALWWYNMIQRAEFDLHNCGDPDILGVLAKASAQGRQVHVLDISTDLGIPVCAAISADGNGRRINIGLGASVTTLGAIRRALAEMVQVSVVDPESMPVFPLDPIQRDIQAWHREATVQQHPYLLPKGVVPANWLERFDGGVPGALKYVLNILHHRDFQIYVANMSRTDLPLKVVRAFVPGLRHFWRRLAPGRLYDIPVVCGWRGRKLAEHELNPTSFFL